MPRASGTSPAFPSGGRAAGGLLRSRARWRSARGRCSSLTPGTGRCPLARISNGCPGAAMAFDYRATFQLHEGRAVLVPSQVALTDIEGPLVLDNRRVTSDGLTMMVESSPVWVRGEIAYLTDAHLDLAIRSASLDLA